jgi:hypothetical protein
METSLPSLSVDWCSDLNTENDFQMILLDLADAAVTCSIGDRR